MACKGICHSREKEREIGLPTRAPEHKKEEGKKLLYISSVFAIMGGEGAEQCHHMQYHLLHIDINLIITTYYAKQ